MTIVCTLTLLMSNDSIFLLYQEPKVVNYNCALKIQMFHKITPSISPFSVSIVFSIVHCYFHSYITNQTITQGETN